MPADVISMIPQIPGCSNTVMKPERGRVHKHFDIFHLKFEKNSALLYNKGGAMTFILLDSSVDQ